MTNWLVTTTVLSVVLTVNPVGVCLPKRAKEHPTPFRCSFRRTGQCDNKRADR